MSRFLSSVWAIAWKDWTRFIRQPFFMVISVVIPLVFIFFYSLIVPTSAVNPIVVAVDDDSPQATQFVQTMRDIHSVEGPYYEIVTTDPSTARDMFGSGEALGMVTIPDGFGTATTTGAAQVELDLHNINSDYSKNLRLRLDHATRVFNDEVARPVALVHETPWLPTDPTMLGYISVGLLLFGVLYASMINTGLNVATEWNDRTIKTLLLAPVGRGALVTGKVVSGLGQSLISILLVLAVLVIGFDFRPVGSPWAMAAVVLLTMLFGAGVGALVGVLSKKALAVTSALITTAVLLFLVSGNEESLRGLAWGQPTSALWQFSRLLPPTYAFTAARSIFLTGDTTTLLRDLSILAAATAVILGGAAWALRRSYSHLTGGQ